MLVENQYGCIMADAMGLGKVRDRFCEQNMLAERAAYRLSSASPSCGPSSNNLRALESRQSRSASSHVPRVWSRTGLTSSVRSASTFVVSLRFSHSALVKWLGPDAISALAIDGKGGKAEMLQRVARWVAASGRNVSQPGTNTPRHSPTVGIDLTCSDDRVLRDASHFDGPSQQLQDWTAAL